MNKHYLSITILLVLAFHTSCLSQWTDVVNNDINFEFKIQDNYYGGGEPDAEGIAEPVIKTELYIYESVDNQYWTNQLCHWWECAPPCTNQLSSWMYWSGVEHSFDTYFSTYMVHYESDNPDPDGCAWYGADDQFGEGYGYLREGQSAMRIVYPSTDFRPVQWIPYLGDGGSGWLYPNLGGEFDQIMALTWRYAAGEGFNDCLEFQTIYPDNTKSDINSNRSVNTQSGVPLDYLNTTGHASADVWYSFTISENSDVSISTSNAVTDFDSVIRLFNQDNTEIGYNDDFNGDTRATLNTQLCVGTYIFCVEGYDTENGLFQVSVTVTDLPDVVITETVSENVSCASATDGSASWNSFGGVSPVEYFLNGVSQSVTTLSDLAIGGYTVEVMDGCDGYDAWYFEIANGDNFPPIAVCETSLSVVVSNGNPAVITVEEVDNGSGDNCEGATASISPSVFDTFDEGDNVVTMTVTDSNGLTAQCICIVNVEVAVGLEELNNAYPITIQPNPNEGSFQLDLSAHNFSSNVQMQIVDCAGRVVYSSKLVNAKNFVILEDVAPGVYLLDLTDNDQKFISRFVVE